MTIMPRQKGRGMEKKIGFGLVYQGKFIKTYGNPGDNLILTIIEELGTDQLYITYKRRIVNLEEIINVETENRI
jgi:hypothetical protein